MDRENEKRAEVIRVRAAFCILAFLRTDRWNWRKGTGSNQRNSMIERGKVSSRFEFSSSKHELLFDR